MKTYEWCFNKDKKAVLLLSAGHYAGDPGGISKYGTVVYEEHPLTARMCWSVAGWLQDLDVPTLLVPSSKLADKITWVNSTTEVLKAHGKTAWAVELHLNIAADREVRGISSIHYPGNAVGRRIGETICDIVGTQTWGNRGPKTPKELGRGGLGWVEKTKPTAVIVEYGFLSNPQQLNSLLQRFDAKMAALAVALDFASLVVEEKLANHPRV